MTIFILCHTPRGSDIEISYALHIYSRWEASLKIRCFNKICLQTYSSFDSTVVGPLTIGGVRNEYFGGYNLACQGKSLCKNAEVRDEIS